MCFSAGTSFITSVALSVTGVYALTQVRMRAQYYVALIPLLFAVQQALEGLLWLTFAGTCCVSWQSWFVYGFLFFAFVVWPSWVPWSLWQLEPNNFWLRIATGWGFLVSTFLAANMLYSGARLSIEGHHIMYYVPSLLTISPAVLVVVYCVPIIGACFASTYYPLRIWGVVVAGTALVSAFVWWQWFTSVWCFFAAVVSVGIVWIISHLNKRRELC